MSETKLVRSMLGVTLAFLLASNAYFFWELHRLGGEVSRWEESVTGRLSELRDAAARCSELTPAEPMVTESGTGHMPSDRKTDGPIKVSRATSMITPK